MSHCVLLRALGVPVAMGVASLAYAPGCAMDRPTNSSDDVSVVQPEARIAPITVSPRASAISEAGDTAFVRIALTSQPRGLVVVAIATSHPFKARVVPSVIAFRPDDWREPQTLEVIAVDDDVFDGDAPIKVVFGPVISPDPVFAGGRLPPVDISRVDDDYVVTGYRAVGLVAGALESRGVAISNRGQVVGDLVDDAGPLRPFLWQGGAVTDLGSSGGNPLQTRALDINDAGTVVGVSSALDGVSHFVYAKYSITRSGVVAALPRRRERHGRCFA